MVHQQGMFLRVRDALVRSQVTTQLIKKAKIKTTGASPSPGCGRTRRPGHWDRPLLFNHHLVMSEMGTSSWELCPLRMEGESFFIRPPFLQSDSHPPNTHTPLASQACGSLRPTLRPPSFIPECGLLRDSLVDKWVENLTPKKETWVQSLEDPLERKMTTCFSIPAREIPMDRGAWWATVHGVAKDTT